MSLSNLSKEHKQYIILGVIVSVALAILIVFGVKVSLSSIAEAKSALQELTTKIETADRSVTRNEMYQDEFRLTISELKECLEDIPPDRNYYSWATEVIYNEARAVHFEIEAIDEMVMHKPAEVNAGGTRVEMETYALRITARGGYEQVKRFLIRIDEHHPLVRVTGMELSTGTGPEVHDIQLFIEWPFNMQYVSENWDSISDESENISAPPDPDFENKLTPPPPRLSHGEAGNEDKPPQPVGDPLA